MYMSIYKIKTKQNKTHVNRKIQKINSKREKKTFLQSQVLEVARKLLTPVVGNNERKRRFWTLSDEGKVNLDDAEKFTSEMHDPCTR